MASKYQAPRGTFDVLPGRRAGARRRCEAVAAAIFGRAGYGRIATPAFEDTELFERGVGRSTDIVRKEMFTFEDKGGRSVTLRPEGTAPICRAYLEHGMHKLAQPVKLCYSGPFFRHERPQAGRFRQFHQIGAEAIGSDSPLADAEVIILLADLLAELGVPGVELRLGSLGSLESRARLPRGADGLPARARGRAVRGRPRADRRQPAARLRLRRRGDAGGDGERADDRRAPRRARTPSTSPRSGRCSTRPGVAYTIDPTLVRGLDYYTRTDLLVRLRPARRPVGDRRRRPLRRPDRAARRAADPGRRLGGRDRADPAGAGGRARRSRRATDVFIVADGGSADRARRRSLAGELRARRARGRDRPRRAQLQGPAEARRPDRRAAAS